MPSGNDIASNVADVLSPSEKMGGFPFVPWSFLGMGVLISWLCCMYLPGLFMAPFAADGLRTLVDYALRAGEVCAFVAFAVLWRRVGPVSSRRGLCVASLILGAAGTGLCPVVASTLGSGPLLFACGFVACGASAVLLLMWAEAYSQLGPTRLVLFAAMSCILAGAIALVVAHLDYVASCVAIACMPPASGVLASISLSRLPGEKPAETVGRAQLPWKLVVLMSLAGLASGFAGNLLLQLDGLGALHRIVATVLFGVVVLVMLGLLKERFDIRVIARFTLPVAVAAFVAIPLFGTAAGEAVSFMVKLAYVSFTGFVLIVLANVVYRHGISSARVFSIARASSEGAMLVGVTLRRAVGSSGALDNVSTLWLITVIGLVAVVGCVALWFSERSVNADWGTTGVDVTSGVHIPTRQELMFARCDELARLHDLTPRETEILGLLAQGRPPEAIEQTLFFSHNTMKTHLRHIYAKLGVHTREEATELVVGGIR